MSKRTNLVAALEKVYEAAVELLDDQSNGDFDQSTLATHDSNALKDACLQYEAEKAQFLKKLPRHDKGKH